MKLKPDCSSLTTAGSRRDFLKRGAAIAGGSALGASLVGSALVQPAWAGGTQVTLTNLSNPAISPNLTAGDAYQYIIQGAPNTAVSNCTQIDGGSWTCSSQGTTNANGVAAVTGNADYVGSYLQSWYVGSTQCSPQLSFRVYPWNTSISKSVMQNVAASALALYQSPGAQTFSDCANPYQTFFTHMDNLGLTPSLVSAIQSYYASNSAPTFNSSLQTLLAANAAGMGWSSILGKTIFQLEAQAQVALSQIQPLDSQAQWDSMGGNYTTLLNWLGGYLGGSAAERAAYGGPSLTAPKVAAVAATAGALIGGGAALMAGSGLTATTVLAVGGSVWRSECIRRAWDWWWSG